MQECRNTAWSVCCQLHMCKRIYLETQISTAMCVALHFDCCSMRLPQGFNQRSRPAGLLRQVPSAKVGGYADILNQTVIACSLSIW